LISPSLPFFHILLLPFKWTFSALGYAEGCGQNLFCGNFTVDAAKEACCNNTRCSGFSVTVDKPGGVGAGW
jgi:hypothetical protein